ncbi:MAG: hypothetical protein WA824_07575 [Candidatus Sulfotelmatobacter sp.]
MPKDFSDDELLQSLALRIEPTETQAAPSRLKSRIYSALVRRQAENGPLLSLTETKSAGHGLCVFEECLRIAPTGESAKRLNPCRICHARILAEQMENPPIYWPNCPYVTFKKI